MKRAEDNEMSPPGRRKICVVTGTRAEYGLLYWLLKELAVDPRAHLQIVATCMHLSPEFGYTLKQIEADGFTVDERVEMLLSSDSAVGTVKSTGLGLIGFADTFSRLQPEIVVLLGDRFEALAAATAALFMRIPVAHLCGGELTLGAFDDSIRHSITKMSALHFVTHPEYARRVLQLGEEPWRVHNVGSISAENVQRLPLLSKSALQTSLGGMALGHPLFLVTYHPATLDAEDPAAKVDALVAALEAYPQATVVFTLPNADPAARGIRERLLAAVSRHSERWHAFDSLGQLRYLSLMSHCDVVVGNSSSGILEAPILGKPTVNIGTRQEGRFKAASIADCGETHEDIAPALSKALSARSAAQPGLLASLAQPSRRMADFLLGVEMTGLHRKRFVDQMAPS